MKILHITAMAPLSPNSGIPVVLKHLTDAQNKIEGVESYVLSLKGDVKDIESESFFCLDNKPISEYLNNLKPDVSIIHSFFHIEYVEAARELKKRNIPFFIEPHGSFGNHAMKKSRIKKIVSNATIFRNQIKGSIGYIFTNKAELDDSKYRTKHDLVIPNGVVRSIVENSKPKTDESFLQPILYFLGRFDIHHKGLDYLFDSLDILEKEKSNIQINIYGTGTKEQEEYVLKRISKYKYLSVTNCGTIYGEAKKDALEKCNILILTSRYEGSPMTVLDGLSYGNPCIVTPGTNVADEISDNNIGWKTQLLPEKIAETIIKAEEDYRHNGKEYYDRCKEYVLNNYSWEKIGEMSVNEIKRIIR